MTSQSSRQPPSDARNARPQQEEAKVDTDTSDNRPTTMGKMDGEELVQVVTKDMSSMEEPEADVIGVLGSGDYGRAIAGKIAQSGFSVLIGSRDPNNVEIL